MTTTLIEPPTTKTGTKTCASPGCHHEVTESWEPTGNYCAECAIDHALFENDDRFCWDCALGADPCAEESHTTRHFEFARKIAGRLRGKFKVG